MLFTHYPAQLRGLRTHRISTVIGGYALSAGQTPQVRRRLTAPGRARLRQRSPLPGAAFSKPEAHPAPATREPAMKASRSGRWPELQHQPEHHFPSHGPNDAALDTVSGAAKLPLGSDCLRRPRRRKAWPCGPPPSAAYGLDGAASAAACSTTRSMNIAVAAPTPSSGLPVTSLSVRNYDFSIGEKHFHRSSRPTDACGAGSTTGPGGPGEPAPSWHSTPLLGVRLSFKKPVRYPPHCQANFSVPPPNA